MTSRTIDIHCNACSNYMFSLQPNDKRMAIDHYCKKKDCQRQAIVDKLKKNENVN